MTSDKEALSQLVFVDNFRKEIAKRSSHSKKPSLELKVQLVRLDNQHLLQIGRSTLQNQFESLTSEFTDELDHAIDSPEDEGDENREANSEPSASSIDATTQKLKSKFTVKIIQSRELKMWIKNPETGKFECSSCKKAYKYSSHVNHHYKSVHLQKKYKCCYFGSAYSLMGSLSRHKNQFHKDKVSKDNFKRKDKNKVQKRYKCIYCGTLYSFATSLWRHKNAAHKDKLKTEREKRKEERKKVKLERELSKVEKVLIFSLEERRKQHQVPNLRLCQEKSKEGKEREETQSKITKEKIQISEKMYLMNPETGKLKCTKCDKEFANTSRSAARDHYESIHLNKRHQCDLCDCTFSTRNNLFQHQKYHPDKLREKKIAVKIKKTGIIYSKRRVKVVGKMCLRDPETRKFICIQCKTIFKSIEGVKIHYESKHLKMWYKCEICNIASYTDSKKLKKHKKTCKDKLVDILAKNRERETNLRYKFKCPTCSKGFELKKVMEEHLNRVHLNERKFVCKICKKSFKSCNYRNKHTKAVHFGRKVKCKVCDRQFSYIMTLAKHEKKCGQKKTEKKGKEICHYKLAS